MNTARPNTILSHTLSIDTFGVGATVAPAGILYRTTGVSARVRARFARLAASVATAAPLLAARAIAADFVGTTTSRGTAGVAVSTMTAVGAAEGLGKTTPAIGAANVAELGRATCAVVATGLFTVATTAVAALVQTARTVLATGIAAADAGAIRTTLAVAAAGRSTGTGAAGAIAAVAAAGLARAVRGAVADAVLTNGQRPRAVAAGNPTRAARRRGRARDTLPRLITAAVTGVFVAAGSILTMPRDHAAGFPGLAGHTRLAVRATEGVIPPRLADVLTIATAQGADLRIANRRALACAIDAAGLARQTGAASGPPGATG